MIFPAGCDPSVFQPRPCTYPDSQPMIKKHDLQLRLYVSHHMTDALPSLPAGRLWPLLSPAAPRTRLFYLQQSFIPERIPQRRGDSDFRRHFLELMMLYSLL